MRPILRLASALGALFCCAVAPALLKAQSFPHAAYVRSETADVRSGPGASFPATDRLERGTEIEVHRRDPGGWLAIRPPEGSFDWVSGSVLKLDGEGRIATAIQSDVNVIVGSRQAAFRPDGEWQVKLDKNETVEVIGRKQIGDQLWYKITPPAGEFRWIREAEVGRKPPTPGEIQLTAGEASPPTGETSSAGPATNPTANAAVPASSGTPKTPPPLLTDTPAPTAPAAIASSPSPAPVAAVSPPAPPGDGFVPRRKGGETGLGNITGSVPGGPSGGSPAAGNTISPTVRPIYKNDDDVARELSDLEIELALTVAQDPLRWNLPPLRARTEAASDVAVAPALRTKARNLLVRMAEFEGLRQRQVQLATIQSSYVPKTPPPTATPASTAVATTMPPKVELPKQGDGASAATEKKTTTVDKSAADKTATADKAAASFDAEGYLMPIITSRKNVPPFALVDDNNELVSFVTPMPGVNLERYKKMKIGVKGTRGMFEGFDKPIAHVTAERVKVLDTKTR